MKKFIVITLGMASCLLFTGGTAQAGGKKHHESAGEVTNAALGVQTGTGKGKGGSLFSSGSSACGEDMGEQLIANAAGAIPFAGGVISGAWTGDISQRQAKCAERRVRAQVAAGFKKLEVEHAAAVQEFQKRLDEQDKLIADLKAKADNPSVIIAPPAKNPPPVSSAPPAPMSPSSAEQSPSAPGQEAKAEVPVTPVSCVNCSPSK